MTYFLSDKRREKLMADLINLRMPEPLATKMAEFDDDHHQIDMQLAALTNQMMHYAKQVKAYEKDDTVETDVPFEMLLLFIKVDQVIIDAYKEEAQERNLAEFPIWIECMMDHIAFMQKNNGQLPN